MSRSDVSQGRCRLPIIGLAMVALLSAIAVGSGCQSGYRDHSNALAAELVAGRYAEAAARGDAAATCLDEDDIDAVILLLEAGRAAQVAGEVETSTRWFGEVHDRVRPYLDTEAEASVGEGAATTIVNQTVAEYRGTPSDRMLAAALNAANLMALQRFDEARVELNRAGDWQQDAVNRFRKEIEAELDRTRQAAEDDDNAPEVPEKVVDDQIEAHFANLDDLTAYADYSNPFIDHLRGVFYLTFGQDQGDRDRARFAFRQVAAMEPEARPMIAPDLEVVESSRRPEPTTWIYFLTGLGPRLEQLRLDIPIPVGNVNYVAAAFPVMKFDEDFAPALAVTSTTDAAGSETVLLADMDRIVGVEFRDRLPLIITQEILSAALKTAATYALQQSLGDWGQIGGIIYQAASTAADTRMWRSVPKRFMLARMPTPADGRLTIASDRPLGEVQVEPGVSNIVMVTLPAAGTPTPSVLSIPLSESASAQAADGRSSMFAGKFRTDGP